MAETEENIKPLEAKKLMDSFANRTGITGKKGDAEERYLWTDAFAMQTFFGLSHIYNDPGYSKYAFDLIDLVHNTLGSFHPEDPNKGPLSRFTGAEANEHPTAGGLRIGKKLPERRKDQPLNENLEWERDGQYFHYTTRWVYALLQAQRESGEKKYGLWAAELLATGEKFLYSSSQGYRMYWKMSTDLSRPLVTGMGRHDPLEGLICAMTVKEEVPEKATEIESLTEKFKSICKGQNWVTNDSLGIGGLLLNTVKAAGLKTYSELPASSTPERLLQDSLLSLKEYANYNEISYPATGRLAFRECGLSLGLRTLFGMESQIKEEGLLLKPFQDYSALAREIENFWKRSSSQQVSTWTEHLNINAVSLAASLVAKFQPKVFGG